MNHKMPLPDICAVQSRSYVHLTYMLASCESPLSPPLCYVSSTSLTLLVALHNSPCWHSFDTCLQRACYCLPSPVFPHVASAFCHAFWHAPLSQPAALRLTLSPLSGPTVHRRPSLAHHPRPIRPPPRAFRLQHRGLSHRGVNRHTHHLRPPPASHNFHYHRRSTAATARTHAHDRPYDAARRRARPAADGCSAGSCCPCPTLLRLQRMR